MDGSPEASRLVLLSQLSQSPPGSKVRFLGCVHEYSGDSANLHLRGRYPDTSASSGNAYVNVNNVLDSLNVEVTQVGSWVNVIGYVRRVNGSQSMSKPGACAVDAVLVWSAGAIKLDDYEAAVKALQDTIP